MSLIKTQKQTHLKRTGLLAVMVVGALLVSISHGEPAQDPQPQPKQEKGFFKRLGSNLFGWGGPSKVYEKRSLEASHPLARGSTLKANAAHGYIHLVGTNSDACHVSARIRVKARTEERAIEIADQVELEMIPDGDQLNVKLKKPKLGRKESVFADFDIVVPDQVNADVHTCHGKILAENLLGDIGAKTSHGKIHLKKLRGNINAHTSHGKIHLEDLQGSAKARTSHGSIRADRIHGNLTLHTSHGGISGHDLVSDRIDLNTSFGSIDFDCKPDKQSQPNIEAKNSHGKIKATISKSFAGTLDAKTSHGSIHCDLPVTIQGKHKEDRLVGKIGEGDGQLKLATSFGNIRIHSN